jgi:hypothetical protein
VFTQPLTEMSTSSRGIVFLESKARPVRRVDNLAAICEPIVYQCGIPKTRVHGLNGSSRIQFPLHLSINEVVTSSQKFKLCHTYKTTLCLDFTLDSGDDTETLLSYPFVYF